MKYDLTTLEGNITACSRADSERVRLKESFKDFWYYIPLEPPTNTEIYCREHKHERFEKMLKQVYGFFRRKV